MKHYLALPAIINGEECVILKRAVVEESLFNDTIKQPTEEENIMLFNEGFTDSFNYPTDHIKCTDTNPGLMEDKNEPNNSFATIKSGLINLKESGEYVLGGNMSVYHKGELIPFKCNSCAYAEFTTTNSIQYCDSCNSPHVIIYGKFILLGKGS